MGEEIGRGGSHSSSGDGEEVKGHFAVAPRTFDCAGTYAGLIYTADWWMANIFMVLWGTRCTRSTISCVPLNLLPRLGKVQCLSIHKSYHTRFQSKAQFIDTPDRGRHREEPISFGLGRREVGECFRS